MTPPNERRLIELLEALADEGRAMPRMPIRVFETIGRLLPLIAVEIGLTRSGDDILLTHRHDRHWNGWHIPGGFIGVEESVATACDRIGRRELGIGIQLLRVIDVYCWPNHPLGSVLSMICHCRNEGEPRDGRWFTELPEPMARDHAELVGRFRKGTTP